MPLPRTVANDTVWRGAITRWRLLPSQVHRNDDSVTTPDGTAVAPSGPDRRARIRQEKFPLDLYGRIVALGPRPRTHVLRPVIVAMLQHRGWTTPAELGELLQMDPANLTKRHLSPMVREGVLARRYPAAVNHPFQTYGAKPVPAR